MCTFRFTALIAGFGMLGFCVLISISCNSAPAGGSQQPECQTDADCAEDEICQDGECIPDEAPPPDPRPPVAKAGSDIEVNEGDSVVLSGEQSSDPDGDELAYSWAQTSGPEVQLRNANQDRCSFTAPDVQEATTLTFALTVSDGQRTDTDQITVTVRDVNQPPTADAGNDQTVGEATSVFLDGSDSTDPDGDTLTFIWRQTLGPSVTLDDENGAETGFAAPEVDADVTCTFELTVSDGRGGTDTDSVNVFVGQVNQAPEANAGSDMTVLRGEQVFLDGSQSSDPDGDTLEFSWTQTGSSEYAVSLDDPSSAWPSFVAPMVDSVTVFTFRLEVNDGHGATAEDTVEITVTPDPIDVLSVEPASAPPGTILKVMTSPNDSLADGYLVVFHNELADQQAPPNGDLADDDTVISDIIVPPMHVDTGHMTVIAPLLQPGTYSVHIDRGGSVGQGQGIAIEDLPSVSTSVADQFSDDLVVLLDAADDWSQEAEVMIGLSTEEQNAIREGFSKLSSILEQVNIELQGMDPDARRLMSQMLVTSGLATQVQGARKALARPNEKLMLPTKYHKLLPRQGFQSLDGLPGAIWFQFLVRMDAFSMVFSNVSSIVTGIIYGGVATCILPPHWGCGLVPAIPTLQWCRFAADRGNNLIKGVFPTDLRQIYVEIAPDEGLELGANETAHVRFYGDFSTQSTFQKEAFDFAIKSIEKYFIPLEWDTSRPIPPHDPELVEKLWEGLESETRRIIMNWEGDGAEFVFDLADRETHFWCYKVPLHMEYYALRPETRFITTIGTLGLLPFADLLQGAILLLLGAEDTLLTNNPVQVADTAVVSFDISTGTLAAHQPGSTVLHVRAYYFDKWFEIPFVGEVVGWKYLEVFAPVLVSTDVDPVQSNLTNAPVSGVVPGVFSTDGGAFEISVSPVDPNGDLISAGLSVDNFSFTPIQVSALQNPGTTITTGEATPQRIEIIPPSDPTGLA